MTGEEYRALVDRLEDYAHKRPGAYRLRVGLLAALGYAYLSLVVLLLAASIAALVVAFWRRIAPGWMLKFGWALLLLAYSVARAFWVRFDPPDGVELRREDAPRLFDMVDQLTSALRAPRFHHILLTGEFNAGVLQSPRLGLLGWQRNYLLLGLPLMHALSPDQFRAVVAHELGHLSGNHSRFFGWIYRVRRTWDQLLGALQQDRHWGSFIFERFFRWYAPFFGAYSFVLARADEYVADRCALETAGARAAGEALIQGRVQGMFVERTYWPGVFKLADRQSDAPATVFTDMRPALRAGISAENARTWLDEAMAEKTGHDDTHPALSDRLTALGYRPEADGGGAVRETAAERFLGTAVDRLAARLDLAWREAIAPQWQERHAYAQESRQKLSALEEKARHQPLTPEESWDRARWTEEFEGDDAAIPLLRHIVAAEPGHAPANYALGQILLEQHDATGIAYIEKAMARDPDAVLSGCESVYLFMKAQGRIDEANQYRDRAWRHHDLLERARLERDRAVKEKDVLLPHGLTPQQTERLREQLARVPQISAAYLVRKAVTHLPEKPLHVLAVVRRRRWFEFFTLGDKDKELINILALNVEFPGEVVVVALNAYNRKLGRFLRNVGDAQIYGLTDAS